MKPAIRKFDQKIDSIVAHLPAWTKPIMELFTLLGQPPFTVGIAAAVLGYGAALEKSHYIIAGAIAIGTLIITSLLKIFLRRARPVNDYVRNMLFQTFSFPSGHASGALVSYGLAAVVVANRWPELAITAWVIALIMSLLIGLSRVYLGAHYASDVVGGWLVGGIGLALVLAVGA